MFIHHKKKKFHHHQKLHIYIYIIVKKQFEEQINIMVVKHGHFLNCRFVHLLFLSLKKPAVCQQKYMCTKM